MTPSIILNELQKYLEQSTSELVLGPDRLHPNIYLVDLPARETPDYEDQNNTDNPVTDIPEPIQGTLPDERDERWPFIIILWSNGEDNEDGYRTFNIDFTFGTEGSDKDSYMDCLHLMEYIRATFMRETWDGWPFRITKPLTMGLHEEQPDNHWLGFMTTTWEVPSIEQEVWKNGF